MKEKQYGEYNTQLQILEAKKQAVRKQYDDNVKNTKRIFIRTLEKKGRIERKTI